MTRKGRRDISTSRHEPRPEGRISVASNADTVGRLLATSTLMKGERELLRKQDEPAPEAASLALSRRRRPFPTI